MTQTVSPPALGEPLPAATPCVEARDRLRRRRSASAQLLTAPGPSRSELEDILTLGARTPDHGKLFPWRFVVLGPRTRAEIAERLAVMAEQNNLPAKSIAVLAKLANPPVTVLVVSTPIKEHSVPVWEQELSAGAVCMNLEHAADSYGYAASWITDWYAYEPAALALFGVGPGEKIAGFIHLGSAAEPPLERPRPDLTKHAEWRP